MERWYLDNEEEQILYSKLYIAGFTGAVFDNHMEQFNELDFMNLEDDAVRNEIIRLISFRNPITNQEYFNIPTWTYVYPSGTKFYRIRRINVNDRLLPVDCIKTKSDLWNPPESCISYYGRLNGVNESLLYVAASNIDIAIEETKLKDDDDFLLISYEAQEDVEVTIVGFHKESAKLTALENDKYRMLTDYFKSLITTRAEDERIYKITSNLIKQCYTIPNSSQDGWVYESVALGKGHNVCFKPDRARLKLKVVGAEVCRMDSDYKFKVKYVLGDLNSDIKLSFHIIGSEYQKEHYPHISLC